MQLCEFHRDHKTTRDIFDPDVGFSPTPMATGAEEDSIVPVVILYNLGLLHHACGLERSDDDVLGQACRIYSLALGLLQKHAISPRNVLLHLALLNNCAHVESCLVRMDQMMSFLRRMGELLLGSDNHDDQLLPLDQDDYAIFFMKRHVCGTDRVYRGSCSIMHNLQVMLLRITVRLSFA
jgi:hypothetical protein